jgi:hypothetical protein
MSSYNKYLKYKNKYIKFKTLIGGCKKCSNTACENEKAHMCANCGNTTGPLSACSQCKQVFYCSKECQKSDWKSHKLNCRKIEVPKIEVPTLSSKCPLVKKNLLK